MTRRHGNEPHFDWPVAEGEPAREVYYSLVTTDDGDAAFWYRYTLISTESGRQEARTWAGLTRRDGDGFFTSSAVDVDEVSFDEPFELAFDDSRLSYEGAEGSLDTDDAEVSWSFSYEPDTVTFTPLRSEKLTDFAEKFLGSGRHWSANQSVRMDGEVEVDGEVIEFTDAPGHQGHTVGASSPDSWSWIHCNSFPEDDAVLEVLEVEGKVSLCFRRDGEVHMLNRLKHVLGPLASESPVNEPGSWRVEAKGEGVDLEISVDVDDEEKYRKAAYLTPDDSSRYVAHSSLTPIEIRFRVEEDDGWSEVRELSSDSARVEWSGKTPPVGEKEEYSPAEYRD